MRALIFALLMSFAITVAAPPPASARGTIASGRSAAAKKKRKKEKAEKVRKVKDVKVKKAKDKERGFEL